MVSEELDLKGNRLVAVKLIAEINSLLEGCRLLRCFVNDSQNVVSSQEAFSHPYYRIYIYELVNRFLQDSEVLWEDFGIVV